MRTPELSALQLSGRAQALSGTVLPRHMLERMAAAQDTAEALRVLAEGGAAVEDGTSAAAALEREKAALLTSFAASDPGRAMADLFRIPYDCHNAKVLLKARLTGASSAGLLSPCGGVPPEHLKEWIAGETAAGLPAWLRRGLDAARRAWTESRSVQLLDVALDRACFDAMTETARQSGSAAAEAYVRLCVDGLNLQTVLRMKQTAAEAVEEMLLPGGSTAPGQLLDALAAGRLSGAFSDPDLRAAAEKGDASGAFRAFGAALKAFSARCCRRPFGAETLLGFFLALELRSAAARLILADKRQGRKAQGGNQWENLA